MGPAAAVRMPLATCLKYMYSTASLIDRTVPRISPTISKFVYLLLKLTSKHQITQLLMPISFALTSIIFPTNLFFLDEKLFMQFKIFEIHKFLQTLLRLEHRQERLAGTRKQMTETWFGLEK